MGNITIKEIARLSGVSSATVSRVLNNNGRFSEETRKRVMDVIGKFEYRPNIVAKSLRTSKSKTIGVIVPDITNEFFASIVLAIEAYCLSHDYSVFICNTSEDAETEKKYIADLEAKGVDGIVYWSGNAEIPVELVTSPIPVVCIDRKPNYKTNGKSIVVIESDNFGGGYQATVELLEKGCRKIVFLRDERDVSTMINRYNGYLHALSEYGCNLGLEYVIKTKVDVDCAKQAMSGFIAKNYEFDGVFATTDWLAVGALVSLQEHGIQVPRDVKLVGFDNISVSQYISPSITTVKQDTQRLGTATAENLLDMINQHADRGHSSSVVVPVEILRRASTGLS